LTKKKKGEIATLTFVGEDSGIEGKLDFVLWGTAKTTGRSNHT